MKIVTPKRRNLIAQELRENPIYRPRVINSKKKYDRKKSKSADRKSADLSFVISA